MKARTMIPASLFDYDFSNEIIDRSSVDDAHERFEAYVRARKWRPADLSPRTTDPIELAERAAALRRLADRAFDEDRMSAYFRILDSLEAYPDTVAEPRPGSYGIPEVTLSYAYAPEVRERRPVISPDCVVNALRDSFAPGEMEMREFFKVAYLDRRNRVLGIQTVCTGGIDSCPVDIRLIFTGALLTHSSQIVISHNHPTGCLKPSVQDDRLTKEIADAGRILRIKLLDHIILTETGYYSYMNEGRL